jgi:hypothetical protein
MAINIGETQNSTYVPDFTWRELPPMDLSQIKASVDAITKDVQSVVEKYNQMQATAEKMVTQPEPAKTSVVDKLTGNTQPQKSTIERMAELPQMQREFQTAMGITDQDIQQKTEMATKMASLNSQLEQIDLKEERRNIDLERQMAGRLTDALRGEQALLKREMNLERANIAYQISALSAQYNVLQGRFDEADKFFTMALNYATQKEKQEVDDYKWALGYNLDLNKEERVVLQQQLDEKQRAFDNKLKLESLRLDQIREARLGAGGDIMDNSNLFDQTILAALADNQAPEIAAQAALALANELKVKVNLSDLKKRAEELKSGQVTPITETKPGIPIVGGLVGDFAQTVPGWLQTEEGKRLGILGGAAKNIQQTVGGFFTNLFGG